jgi:tRNA-Thr(GGU) m(6)t(6)A37 methyltransferase TsaA
VDNYDQRPGEVRLPFDPVETADDAAIIFIGKINSPWKTRSECPRNIRQARERGLPATLEIDEAYRQGLQGLETQEHAIVLYWMQQARRDLIIQQPRHRDNAVGVFALRSPARPNPIAIATVRILAVDQVSGSIQIDAIDCLDGTALLDIKPWLAAVDTPSTRQ